MNHFLHRLTPAPPLGWNSFDSFGCFAREKDLLRNLDTFVERLQPHGYTYFVLDAGWYREYERAPGEAYPRPRSREWPQRLDGHGRPLPARWAFPSGLGPVIRAAHAAGVKFGIHMMRGISRVAVEQRLPVEGTPYTADEVANLDDGCAWCPDNVGVNLDHPGGQAFYDGQIALLASWGVDYLKYDDIVQAPREVEAVIEAIGKCGRDIALSLSPGHHHDMSAAPTYVSANCMRVSGDMWDERSHLPYGFDCWERFLPWVDDERPGFWLDLDMIPFGHLKLCHPVRDEEPEKPLMGGLGVERMSAFTSAQKRTYIVNRALASSPLFMGGNLPTSDEESFALLTDRNILACNQRGRVGRPVTREEGLEIWRSVERDAPGRGWLGVFNRREADPLRYPLAAGLFGESPPVRVRDVWRGEDFTVGTEPVHVEIAPDDVAFLRYGGDA